MLEAATPKPISHGLPGLSSPPDDLADLSSDEGWRTVRDDELRLQHRHLPERGAHAFRATCELDAPVEHLVAMAREIDLYPTWNKYVTTANILQRRNETDVTFYMTVWVPWPISQVGLCSDAVGTDVLAEEGRFVIMLCSPKKGAIELPEAAKGHRKIRLQRPTCMVFTPLPPSTPGGKPRTLAQVMVVLDPGIRHLPCFIMTFVLKILCPFIYNAVKKVLASAFRTPDSPLPQRIGQRAELYEIVRQRAQEALAAMMHRNG
ncbi:hypothetical protein GPECTOR_25g389 [Gonium pectorale]|uniref:START domain-containing protein n=1 Tax=Gonium pectorale TaxID=33097 RepID=A0A150GGQ4_GONPE|nr:hypothetical protein GPECTOR_25g389 [Gonium pectorale]|eukprot:KXZ48805.1 hypothetical protein GPECTOR_25g389 [Gonium pectorale]